MQRLVDLITEYEEQACPDKKPLMKDFKEEISKSDGFGAVLEDINFATVKRVLDAMSLQEIIIFKVQDSELITTLQIATLFQNHAFSLEGVNIFVRLRYEGEFDYRIFRDSLNEGLCLVNDEWVIRRRLYNERWECDLPIWTFTKYGKKLYSVKHVAKHLNFDYLNDDSLIFFTYNHLFQMGLTHDLLYEHLGYAVEGLTRNEFIEEFLSDNILNHISIYLLRNDLFVYLKKKV